LVFADILFVVRSFQEEEVLMPVASILQTSSFQYHRYSQV